jgi:hypothetical protein
MDTGRPSWQDTWGATIRSLIHGGGNDLLSPNNRAVKPRYQEKPELAELAAAFVASLLDETKPAAHAQQVLDQIRLLFPVLDENKQPRPLPASKFPTATYRSLLELISAKMLWQMGETWAVPGSNKVGSDKKPDYEVYGRTASEEVADHLIVQTGMTASDLTTLIGKGITLKLAKYDGVAVRVVVHVSESPAYRALTDVGHDGWQKLVGKVVAGMEVGVTERLSMVVIIAGTEAHQFTRKQLGL